MLILSSMADYDKCVKAFHAENADSDFDCKDETCFFVRSDVKPDKDYLLTGVWKRSFSEFSKCINTILQRLKAVISLDAEITNAIVEGYKGLINNNNKGKCCSFYCSDALQYCYIHLRVNSLTLGFGFHLTAYCASN